MNLILEEWEALMKDRNEDNATMLQMILGIIGALLGFIYEITFEFVCRYYPAIILVGLVIFFAWAKAGWLYALGVLAIAILAAFFYKKPPKAWEHLIH